VLVRVLLDERMTVRVGVSVRVRVGVIVRVGVSVRVLFADLVRLTFI
jgi:hypothetical protein